MILWLSVLFVVVPLAELTILLQLGRFLGVLPTVGIVLATGVSGAVLVHVAGASVLSKIKGQLARGEIPADGLIEGVLVLVGGVLLITPGILTDLTGFALLFPPTRILFREKLKQAFRKRVRRIGPGGFKDVHVEVLEPEDRQK